jgi:hypothetical protein
MLVHGFAPAPNLHFGFTMPIVWSSLRWILRLTGWPSLSEICDLAQALGWS